MIKLRDLFQQINDLLPVDKKCSSFSVCPMPYDGYFELYVETTDKVRYRCMCTPEATISPLVEFKLPYQVAKEK